MKPQPLEEAIKMDNEHDANMDNKNFNPAHPSQSNELEIRIVNLIEKELLKTSWAKESFDKAKGLLLSYFKDSIKDLGKPKEIQDKTQELLKKLSDLLNSKIASGENYLKKLPSNSPVFILTNHLGAYKLIGIKPKELGLDAPVDVIHPFPMFYASLYPLAHRLDKGLYEAAYPFIEPISKIQEAAGYIAVPGGKGVFSDVLEATKRTISKYKKGLFVIFPEGGTSGKRSMKGPYDLEHFHTGVFAIAALEKVPILPVAQYFNPKTGYELGVFEPIYVKSEATKEYLSELASQTQSNIQKWINERKALS